MSTIGNAEELELASTRPDGMLRPYIDDVGRAGWRRPLRPLRLRPENPWYRRAKASGIGRIRAGGLERDVTFADAAAGVHAALDAAYHAKYDPYGPKIVGTVVAPRSRP